MIILVLQANAIGRSAKTVREFLEKHYTDEVADSDDETIKLAIKALLEVSSFIFWLGYFSCVFSKYKHTLSTFSKEAFQRQYA